MNVLQHRSAGHGSNALEAQEHGCQLPSGQTTGQSPRPQCLQAPSHEVHEHVDDDASYSVPVLLAGSVCLSILLIVVHGAVWRWVAHDSSSTSTPPSSMPSAVDIIYSHVDWQQLADQVPPPPSLWATITQLLSPQSFNPAKPLPSLGRAPSHALQLKPDAPIPAALRSELCRRAAQAQPCAHRATVSELLHEHDAQPPVPRMSFAQHFMLLASHGILCYDVDVFVTRDGRYHVGYPPDVLADLVARQLPLVAGAPAAGAAAYANVSDVGAEQLAAAGLVGKYPPLRDVVAAFARVVQRHAAALPLPHTPQLYLELKGAAHSAHGVRQVVRMARAAGVAQHLGLWFSPTWGQAADALARTLHAPPSPWGTVPRSAHAQGQQGQQQEQKSLDQAQGPGQVRSAEQQQQQQQQQQHEGTSKTPLAADMERVVAEAAHGGQAHGEELQERSMQAHGVELQERSMQARGEELQERSMQARGEELQERSMQHPEVHAAVRRSTAQGSTVPSTASSTPPPCALLGHKSRQLFESSVDGGAFAHRRRQVNHERYPVERGGSRGGALPVVPERTMRQQAMQWVEGVYGESPSTKRRRLASTAAAGSPRGGWDGQGGVRAVRSFPDSVLGANGTRVPLQLRLHGEEERVFHAYGPSIRQPDELLGALAAGQRPMAVWVIDTVADVKRALRYVPCAAPGAAAQQPMPPHARTRRLHAAFPLVHADEPVSQKARTPSTMSMLLMNASASPRPLNAPSTSHPALAIDAHMAAAATAASPTPVAQRAASIPSSAAAHSSPAAAAVVSEASLSHDKGGSAASGPLTPERGTASGSPDTLARGSLMPGSAARARVPPDVSQRHVSSLISNSPLQVQAWLQQLQAMYCE